MNQSVNNYNRYRLRLALLLMSLLLAPVWAIARQYNLDHGKVAFSLQAPAGELMAENKAISGFMNTTNGNISFDVRVDQFRFVSVQMPDYINERSTKRFCDYYLETEKYPVATFRGRMININAIDLSKDGVYQVQVEGIMTMHGTTRKIVRPATIRSEQGRLVLQGSLVLKLADFEIPVPEMVKNFFFKQVKLDLTCVLVP